LHRLLVFCCPFSVFPFVLLCCVCWGVRERSVPDSANIGSAACEISCTRRWSLGTRGLKRAPDAAQMRPPFAAWCAADSGAHTPRRQDGWVPALRKQRCTLHRVRTRPQLSLRAAVDDDGLSGQTKVQALEGRNTAAPCDSRRASRYAIAGEGHRGGRSFSGLRNCPPAAFAKHGLDQGPARLRSPRRLCLQYRRCEIWRQACMSAGFAIELGRRQARVETLQPRFEGT